MICVVFTTKTGDVLIKSLDEKPGVYRVVNYKADSEEISSVRDFTAKFTLPTGA